MNNQKVISNLYRILLAAFVLLCLVSVSTGCTTYIPVPRDPELTKPIKKVPPRNKHGEPFGPGTTWADYETALIEQWKEVDHANDRFDVLRK